MKTIPQSNSEAETIIRIVRCDKCNRPRRLADVIPIDCAEWRYECLELCQGCARSNTSIVEVLRAA